MALGAELDEAAIARLAGRGIDQRPAGERCVALRQHLHAATGRGGAAALRQHLRPGLQLDIAARLDGHRATLDAGTAGGGQRARDLHVGIGDDLNLAIAQYDGAAGCEAVRVDHVGESGRGARESRAAVEAAADLDGPGGDADAVGGIHLPLNRYGCRRIARCGAAQQLVDGAVIGIAGRTKEVVGKGPGRRRDADAAGIDHSARPDDHTVGVGKPQIAADAAILDCIELAVDVAALVAHDIDQVARTRRQMQVGRRRRGDIENLERVEGIVVAHRTGRDIGDRTNGRHAGLGLAIGPDCLCRGKARHEELLHCKESDQRGAPAQSAQRPASGPHDPLRDRSFDRGGLSLPAAACDLRCDHPAGVLVVPDKPINVVHDEHPVVAGQAWKRPFPCRIW